MKGRGDFTYMGAGDSIMQEIGCRELQHAGGRLPRKNWGAGPVIDLNSKETFQAVAEQWEFTGFKSFHWNY